MARVRAVSRTDVMNMRTSPKMATTTLRKATLMLEVPALFIRRVSCSDIWPLKEGFCLAALRYGITILKEAMHVVSVRRVAWK